MTTPTPQAPETMAEHVEQPSILDQIVAEDIGRDKDRFDYAYTYAGVAAQSGYYPDAGTQAQAAMKIMAGYELGLSPTVSLNSGFDLIKGRVSMSGGLVAALLQRHGFHWKFGLHNENGCELFPYYKGRPLLDQNGQHAPIIFSRSHADRAGLTEKQGDKKDKPSMYDKYGEDMYFNRCIARFQRRFAPGVTRGIPIYTPDEIDEIAVQGQPAATQMPQRKAAE